MKITNLTLKNYRNYQLEKLEFGDSLNVLVGKNAQGKTNILEAIFFTIIGRSFKTSKEKECILFGQNNAYVKAQYKKLYRDTQIELIFSQNAKKSVKVDGFALKRIGELMGSANAVFFSPDELALIKDSPDERRKFMNVDICQTNKRYFYLLGRYEKVLANRNKLLKTSQNLEVVKQTIDIWDRALCDISKKIAFERKKFIDNLTPFASKAHSYISGGKETLELKYSSFCDDIERYDELMKKALQKNLEKDFKLGYTSIGPHRDDIDIYLNGVEVKSFGSQGQQRTVALSMKLAELEIIKEQTGEYPILLLDDVFSELDASRRQKLLNFTSKTQTIITTTDFDLKIEGAKVFKVDGGTIIE